MVRIIWFASILLLAFGVAPGNAANTERPAALDGTAYAVIAPIFNDAAGSQSYIRLFNGGASTANFIVTIVGSPSGQTYGTATIAIPANASPQYVITQLLTLANAPALNGGDNAYAVYLQSTEAKTGYQHIVFNAPTLLFQNASVCNSLINEVMGPSSGRVLTNVHTSLFSTYPSTIYLHNYRNTPLTYRVTVIDAGYADATTGAIRTGSGAIIGSKDVVVGANTTYVQPFTFFQTALGWTPSATQFHANIIVTNPSGGTSYDLVSQAIANVKLGGELNMTTTCAINPPSTATAIPATTFAGTIAGNGGQTGTLSVTVQASLAAAASAPLLTAQSAVEKTQAVSQATGTLVTGGSTITLSGTYESSTGASSLTGGGYTFTGTVASGVFSGAYTGPNSTDGGFSALNATLSPVTRYCGAWHTTEAKDNTGTFNMQITTSGVLTGVTYGGKGVILTGTVSGANVSGSSSEGVSFSGTVTSAGTVSGTFVPKDGGSGSFSGTSCS